MIIAMVFTIPTFIIAMILGMIMDFDHKYLMKASALA